MKKAMKTLGWAVLLVALTQLGVYALHLLALHNSPGAFAPVSASSTQ